MDYNEIAAYLESLQARLNHYKAERLLNMLFSTVLIALVLVGVVLGIQPTFPRLLIPILVLFLEVQPSGVLTRMWRTNAAAHQLEKEVEMLRYRLVAEDINLEKPKRKNETTHHLEAFDQLGHVRVGDDGELVIAPSETENRDQRRITP